MRCGALELYIYHDAHCTYSESYDTNDFQKHKKRVTISRPYAMMSSSLALVERYLNVKLL